MHLDHSGCLPQQLVGGRLPVVLLIPQHLPHEIRGPTHFLLHLLENAQLWVGQLGFPETGETNHDGCNLETWVIQRCNMYNTQHCSISNGNKAPVGTTTHHALYPMSLTEMPQNFGQDWWIICNNHNQMSNAPNPVYTRCFLYEKMRCFTGVLPMKTRFGV